MLAALTLIIGCLTLANFNVSKVNEISDVTVFFIILLFSVAYICSLSKSRRLKDVQTPLLCGYVWRVLLMLFDLYGRYIYVLPNAAGDAEMYYLRSVMFATGAIGKQNIEGFPKIIGTIFSYTGISRVLGQFLVLLCSIVTLHAVGWILSELSVNKQTKRKSMYILGLLPNFAILSVVFLRESLVTMFVSLSLYCFVRWYTTKKEIFFLGAFALVFCGARFHSGVVGVSVGYIIVRMLYDNTKNKIKLSGKGIFIAVLSLFVFIYLFNNYSETLFSKMQNVESLDDVANMNTLGDSSYAAYVGNSDTPLNMVIYTPLRIAYFLFSPFPWQWRGLGDVIAFCFSSIFYLYTVYRAISFLGKGYEENRTIIITLLIIAICTVFVFAWGTANTGTAARHREKMVALYLVMYAITPKIPKIEKTKRSVARSGGTY